MITHLIKHGDGYAIIIDRSLFESLNIAPDTPLEIKVEGNELIIEPDERSERRCRIDDALAKINAQYPKMMKRLAE